MPSLHERLVRIARSVRNELLRKEGDLCAQCLEVSKALSERLAQKGYRAKVIRGTFAIDNPNWEFYDEWDPSDFKSPEAMEFAIYHPLHYWVEAEGFLLDITADQFSDEVDERLPAVVVGRYRDLPRYRKNVVLRA